LQSIISELFEIHLSRKAHSFYLPHYPSIYAEWSARIREKLKGGHFAESSTWIVKIRSGAWSPNKQNLRPVERVKVYFHTSALD